MKGDLNLVPKKESIISKKAFIIILLASLISLSAIGYFLVYLPNVENEEITREVRAKQTELEIYNGLEEEYSQLLLEITELNVKSLIMEDLKNRNIEFTKRLDDIGKGIPVDIIIQKISYTDGAMEILGNTPDYEKVAQFMINLKQMPNVTGVVLSGVDSIESPIQTEDGEDDSNQYVFDLTVYYKMNESLLDIDEPNMPIEEGGEQ